MRTLFVALYCFAPSCFAFAGQALIVADEVPAMEVLAKKLKTDEGIESKIVLQAALPADLAPFTAVIVYIHKDLNEPVEKALIAYAKGGGKLIVLHHSISSGKRKNKEWFNFLGVTLPTGDVDKGGYKWTEGVTLDVVNLAPEHFITANKVKYPAQIAFKKPDSGAEEKMLPGVTLKDSEVYLNHVLAGQRTLLLGLKCTDAKTGKTYMQTHAGWIKPAEKGQVIYLMPGHSVREFEDPTYSRIVLNAAIYQP